MTSQRRLVCLILALALVCQANTCFSEQVKAKAADPAPADGVLIETLANGMTVILKPVRTAPVVCVRGYVRAGGLYEGEWLGCGISHLTEHLVAKGAVHDMGPDATVAEAKQTSDRVRRIGGQSNAYTSLGHTCYYIAASAGKAEQCVELIADWLARPEITEEDFQREHGVVQRELEMRQDAPNRQMWEAHMAAFYATHPAAVPVIGYSKPLSDLTHEDVLAYHSRMYVPQNMVFCVVGDIDAPAMLKKVREAFADFQPGRVPDLTLPDARPLWGVRREVRTHPELADAMARLSFQTIPLLHEDLYALDVLSYILAEGKSSRLYRKLLRQEKLVTSISSSSWTPAWGKGQFSFSYRCQPDKADAAEAAIMEELKDIISQGVDEEELERAKRQKIADFVYAQQSVESQSAMLATDFLSSGDVRFSRSYTEWIQAVTAEQVREAAERHFDLDAMVITRLVPASEEGLAVAQATTGPAGSITSFTLPNGLRVILRPTEAAGLVAMAFVTEGGVLMETPATNGLGRLMAELSTKGTAGYTAEQIAEFFDKAGGSIGGNCGNNTFYWQATVLADSFEPALRILAEVVSRPTFPPEELEILRPAALASIRRIDEQWQSQLQKFFRQGFFLDSPFRLQPIGCQEVVEAATAEQIAEYHRRAIKAGSSVLAIFGDFDTTSARRDVEELFDPLASGRVELVIPQARQLPAGGQMERLETDKQVTGIIVASPGMKIDNMEDRFAITVLDTIISGYRLPDGWLHEELRGKQLVYVVHAYNWAMLAPGAFVTYAACQPEKADEVVEIIQRNLDKAAGYEPSPLEIELAVNAILTAELLENQSPTSLALLTALDELYGLGYDFRSRIEPYYRAVTPADVARVGRKYLSRPRAVFVVGPQPAAETPAQVEATSQPGQ